MRDQIAAACNLNFSFVANTNEVLLIPIVFTQQYYRLDVSLIKLHVSTFVAIIRLTRDLYQLRYKGGGGVAVPMGSHGLHCLCIYLTFS